MVGIADLGRQNPDYAAVDAWLSWANKENVDVVYDDGGAYQLYNAGAVDGFSPYPLNAIVDPQGKIAYIDKRYDPPAALEVLAALSGTSEMKKSVSPNPRKYRAFPNPFQKQTSIQLSGLLRGDKNSSIRIYHMNGALLRILTPMGTGSEIRAHWDGKDKRGVMVLPGTYLYRIESEGKVFGGTLVRMDY